MITTFRYSEAAGFEETHDSAGLVEVPAKGAYLWVDLQAPTPEEADVLTRLFGFHPLAVEDCWHEPQHSKVDDYGNHVFMVVHGFGMTRSMMNSRLMSIFFLEPPISSRSTPIIREALIPRMKTCGAILP